MLVLVSKIDNEFVIASEDYEALSFTALDELKKGIYFYLTLNRKINLVINEGCFDKALQKMLKQLNHHYVVVTDSVFNTLKQLL